MTDRGVSIPGRLFEENRGHWSATDWVVMNLPEKSCRRIKLSVKSRSSSGCLQDTEDLRQWLKVVLESMDELPRALPFSASDRRHDEPVPCVRPCSCLIFSQTGDGRTAIPCLWFLC